MSDIWRRPITGRWHMFRKDGVHFVDGTAHWTTTCSPEVCGEPTGRLQPFWRSVRDELSGRFLVWRWRIGHRRWR